MNNRLLALFSAGGATIIYGLNHTIAKEVMPNHVGAFGFIFIRTAGATILFWIVSLFVPVEKIDKKDYIKLFFAALLGMCLNMLSFFKGLELSTPVNSGIFATTNPIIILCLSYFFLNEKIGVKKFIGIALGFIGALVLVLQGTENSLRAPNVSRSTSVRGYPQLSWVLSSQERFKRIRGAGCRFSSVRPDQPLAGLISL